MLMSCHLRRLLSNSLNSAILFRSPIVCSYSRRTFFSRITNFIFGSDINNNKQDKSIKMSGGTDKVDSEIKTSGESCCCRIQPNKPDSKDTKEETPADLKQVDHETAAKLESLAISGEKKPDDKTKPKDDKPTKTGKGKQAAPVEPEKPLDVSRLDLRIGKIIEVDRHPDADSLYVEKIDCGDPTGPRTVISGLVKHVPIEEMRDRYVVVLCNLKPAKMRGILSEAMVMCASTPDKVELISPPTGVKPGDRVVFDNYSGEPDVQLNPKKKIWEQIAPDIKTDANGVAKYKEAAFKVSHLEGEVFKSNLANVQIR